MSTLCKYAIAATALAACAEANIQSSYSRDRMSQVRTHLEKIYGRGIVGMFDDEGKLSHERMRWAR